MQKVKDIIIEALDYAGARTSAGDFSNGEVFAMAYRELVNAIRNINAEPRYSFGYQIAKTVVTKPGILIGNIPHPGDETGLLTEGYEHLHTEFGEWLNGENAPVPPDENRPAFAGPEGKSRSVVPYRIAKVYDGSGEYARSDRSDVIQDRELNRTGFRQFAYNQDREDYGILELSQVPSGELTIIAEKQITEPDSYEDWLDMPRNVYKFVIAWLARSLCRKLGNAEMLPLAEMELANSEKPFIATNERNKRDARINPHRAYARLGNG